MQDVDSAARMRLGLVAVALSGVVNAATIIVRGPFADPAFNPDTFVAVAGSSRFVVYALGTVLAVLLGVYAFIGLYAYLAYSDRALSRVAFWGMVLNIGLVLLLPSLGIYAFAGPPLSQLSAIDAQRALGLAKAFGSGTYLAVVLLQALFYCVGSLLFGIAIWRCRTLARWAGALFFLQAPLIQFAPLISHAGEIAGALMLAVSSVWIAYVGWHTLERAVDKAG